MDQAVTNIEPLVPLSAFLLGIGGSLHCVGMCGGLVVASTNNKTGVVVYQLGRLLGYMVLATIAAIIGTQLNNYSTILGLIGSIALGGFFILWGVQTWRKKPLELKLPHQIQKLISKAWSWSFRLPRTSSIKSFVTGSLSLFLPCGLLWGALFGLILLNRPESLALGIFAFWLGTLPAMLFAPQVVQKILGPLTLNSPILLSLVFIGIGLGTVGWRFFQVLGPSLLGIEASGEMCH